MLRFLFSGDWHIRGTNPRNRTDDYKEAVKAKLREVFALAKKWDCTAILVPGDIFHSPEVSISVLLEFVEVLREAPVRIFTTPGNHDVYGYNVATYERSSLKLLEMLVPLLTVITDPAKVQTFTDGESTAVEVTFTPFSSKMDINGYGYSPESEPTEVPTNYWKPYRIHVAHGMLLDHTPPFDRYTLVQEVVTAADLVLTGHDHIGYGIYERLEGTKFCNPGALTRLSASVSEIERPIQVALITVEHVTAPNNNLVSIKLLPLTTAKPGDQVLDRSKIEADKARAYAMETFSTLIQTQTGDRVLLDVNHIVEQIAELDKVAPHILKAALEAIDEQREKVRP